MHRRLIVLCLCLGCGGASQAPAAAHPAHLEAAPPVQASAVPAELGMPDAMQVHFAYVTAARDAVISGDLSRVRPALLALAATPPTADVPVDWAPWLQDVQGTARQGAASGTLEAAATAVAALANACGDCHRSTRSAEGSAAHTPRRYDPEDRKGLEEKMARHQFSADALWVGLTEPEHQAWAVGAAALMNIHVPGLVDIHGKPATTERRPTGQGELQGPSDPRLTAAAAESGGAAQRSDAVDLDAALEQLRRLGTQADQARTSAEKQVVFAQLITRCGHCHAALGIELESAGALGTTAAAAQTAKRVSITADKVVITEKIQFDFNAASIQSASHALLAELVAVIQAHPEIRKLSIEGHTDSDGDANYNLKLSRERAAAVRRYLIEHGIQPTRLAATGFGAQRPIAINDTAEGREANRRVEFLIVDQAAVKQTYELDPVTGESRLAPNPP